MYRFVALSDLTSVVEERCHGGQSYWDVSVSVSPLFVLQHLQRLPTVRIVFCLCFTTLII